jgi:hypothetical protein
MLRRRDTMCSGCYPENGRIVSWDLFSYSSLPPPWRRRGARYERTLEAVWRFVRPGYCEGDYLSIGCSLCREVDHLKDNAALPFLLGLAKKRCIHRCGNVFFSTISTDRMRAPAQGEPILRAGVMSCSVYAGWRGSAKNSRAWRGIFAFHWLFDEITRD